MRQTMHPWVRGSHATAGATHDQSPTSSAGCTTSAQSAVAVQRLRRRAGPVATQPLGVPKASLGRTISLGRPLPAAIAAALGQTPGEARRRFSGRPPGVHYFRRSPHPQQVKPDLPPRHRRDRSTGGSAARAGPHRSDPRCGDRRDHQEADAPAWALLPRRRAAFTNTPPPTATRRLPLPPTTSWV